MILTLGFFLLVIHIHLQQTDEHSKHDTKELQVGTGFTDLVKDQNITTVTWK